MLEIRPNCEHCNKDLAVDATDVMICTFECTYCSECAMTLFKNVCPNCTGGFVARPIRPSHLLVKYPPSKTRVFSPKDLKKTEEQFKNVGHISPEKR